MNLMKRFLVSMAIPAIALLVAATTPARVAVAQSEPGGAETPACVVLDTYGFWRMHHTLQPPVLLDNAGTLSPALLDVQWTDIETPAAPDGWAAPEFDDGSWLRGPARMACRTPYLSRLCLRGVFGVTDPSKAVGLNLTLVYQGGAIVYLNGKEIARQDIAPARPGHPVLAAAYPVEAFVAKDGKLLRGWQTSEEKADAETRRRVALRVRTLRHVALPRDLLRKGPNVLAVEIVRAPYPPAIRTGKKDRPAWNDVHTNGMIYEPDFNTCQLVGLQLAAPRSDGLEPNAVRAAGLRAWNSDLLAADFDMDFGGQGGEPLRPVRITAVRNGAFCGKFVVGSREPIRKLTVTAGDLASGSATLPASAVRVRFAEPWGREGDVFGTSTRNPDNSLNRTLVYRYTRKPTLLGALMDRPAEEVAVAATRSTKEFEPDPRIPAPPEPMDGAVVPVWITVNVPRGAAPGDYTGKVTVVAEGAAPIDVPLAVKVVGWTLPEPEDFGTWIDMIQSPDTLALEYDVPLWSDRHWALIARSMDLLRGVGNRVLYVPLICQSNLGNAESMVRWIDRGNGRYEWDFSVMDKYLDHCLKHMGPPSMIVLYAWEIYFAESKQLKPDFDARELGKEVVEAREAFKGKGPMVTVVDPATGTVEARHLPQLLDPNGKPLWKELFSQLRSHMDRRGLTDRLRLGTMSDAWPSRSEVQFFAEVAGDLRWFSDSHPGIADLQRHMEQLASGNASRSMREASYPTVTAPKDEMAVLARADYTAHVFSLTMPNESRTGDSLMGWKNPIVDVQHDRHAEFHTMTHWHNMPEVNVLGGQRGVGRLGGDWWRCVRNQRGLRVGL
ncbi:MAG TPA: hypothetical protein PLP01_13750, partial [Phycisphaerae bacterium]|nr:hypothetical protein [Phycisphaerae bacterium]